MSTAEVALRYVRRGWNPVPVPFKSKKPSGDAWQKRIIGESDIRRYFNGQPQNIGVLLGTTSNGLTDVDLDCDEAIALAPWVLPKTPAIFGRKSKRFSHYLYRTNLSETAGKAEIAFVDPLPAPNTRATLVELRIGGDKGAQTVFPGSTHETDEAIGWEEHGEPAQVDGETLCKLVSRLGAASALARHWCHGDRHKAAYALGGFFSRAGLSEPEVGCLVEGIAKAAGDEEFKDRHRAARDGSTADKRKGYPSLVEHFGERVAKKVADWLDYKSSDDEQEVEIEKEQHRRIKADPYIVVDPATIPLRDWLYGRIIIRQFVTGTVAPGGVGKSTLLAADVLSMVSARPLLGVTPPQPLKVWLWNLEDPLIETQRKIEATRKHYGLGREDIEGRLFINSGRDTPLVIARANKNGATIVEPLVDNLIEECRTGGIDVLIIDPFVSSHEVPENDNSMQDMIVKKWGFIADRANIAVHLVDHTRKPTGGDLIELTTESSRGAKSKTDGLRAVRVINRMTDKEGEQAGIENHRLYFRTYNDKGNLAPPADKSEWFKLASIDLGNGPINVTGAGIGGDSVGVVTTWEWPDQTANVTGQDFNKAAALIRAGRWRENQQATAWVGTPIAQALGLNIKNKADKYKVTATLKMWLDAGNLRVVIAEDEKRNPRKFIEVADHVDD